MAKKWISSAIKHKGSLTKAAKKMGGFNKKTGKIKKSFISKMLHSQNPTMRRRAQLAKTLGKLHKR